MLPKKNRMNTHEVTEVLKKGRMLHSTHISMKHLPNTTLKLSAIVPKSLARKAVGRNRLRRAVYRAFTTDEIVKILPSLRGSAAFFVRAIPKKHMTSVFVEDIKSLVKNF